MDNREIDNYVADNYDNARLKTGCLYGYLSFTCARICKLLALDGHNVFIIHNRVSG